MRLTRLTLALAAALVAFSATPTFAADATWRSITVAQQPEQPDSMLIVSGELAEETKLPAQVELAIPAGTQLQWIGEVLGGPVSEDPSVEYTLTTSNGMDVYRFTLTRSRTAQLEGLAHATAASSAAETTEAIRWTAWRDLPEVSLRQRIPADARITVPVEGADTVPGSTGYSYYSKTFTNVKAGQPLELAFTRTAGTAAADPAAASAAGAGAASGAGAARTSSGADTLIVVLILAIFAIGGVAVVVGVRGKLAAKSGGASDAHAKGGRASDTRAANASSDTSAQRASSADASWDEDLDDEPQTAGTPGLSAGGKRVLAVAGVIVVLVGGALAIANNATSSGPVDNKITRSFGSSSECDSMTVSVQPGAGVDLAKQGGDVIGVFEGSKGVGTVTLDIAASTVHVKFCESYQTPDSIRGALSSSGLVTVQ